MNVHECTDPQKRFWDEESSDAETYCRRFLEAAEKNHWLEMLQKVERQLDLTFRGEILELGGGSQFLSRWLASRSDTHVICTDISEKRLMDFNRHYGVNLPNLSTVGHVNAERLPYPDAHFDFIIGDAVLHHIENVRAALYEVRRCMKPGGLGIFIREPVVGHLDFLRRSLRRRWRANWRETYSREVKEYRYEYWKTVFQWREEFYRAGLDVQILPGWYELTLRERWHSRFPVWFGCSVTFVLSDTAAMLPH